MIRDLERMEDIQKQKQVDIKKNGIPPLDAEVMKKAEHKRFTFDVIDTPTDPLR